MVQILAIFRTCLVVRYIVLRSQRACLLLIYHDVVNKVDFVSKHDDLGVRVCVLPDFAQPVVHVLKAVLICYVVDNYYPRRAFVVRMGKRAEFHLASSVPDGHAHLGVLVNHIFLFVVDASRTDEVALEHTLRVPVQDAALPHASVAQQRNFYRVVWLSH